MVFKKMLMSICGVFCISVGVMHCSQIPPNESDTISALEARFEARLAEVTATYEDKLAKVTESLEKLISENMAPKTQLSNTVAFAASPNSEAYYEGLQRVAYGDIQLNLGDAFDGTVFTCPASGLYLFSVSVRGSPDHVFEAYIEVGSTMTGHTVANFDNGFYSGDSVTTIAQCNAGDPVSVRIAYTDGNRARVTMTKTNYFTGALLQVLTSD